MKYITSIITLGALGLGLAACSNGNSGSTLTPQPPNNNVQPTGRFTQIERLSRPAIKEVFETFNQHQISNAIEPYNDPTLQAAIKGTEDFVRPPKNGTDYGAALQGVLYPDEYTVNLASTTGGYLGAETKLAPFGGRNISDDVIATSLGALFGNTLSKLGLIADDGQENNCLSAQNIKQNPNQAPSNSFPYLHIPH